MKLYRRHALALWLLGIGAAALTAAWPLPELTSEPSRKAAPAAALDGVDARDDLGEREDAASCPARCGGRGDVP